MKFMAFDLGQHMAVAHNLYGDARAAHMDLAPKGTRAERLEQCDRWLAAVFAQAAGLGLETVVYERPFARGEAATRALWGYAAMIEAHAYRAGCAIIDITPSTVKKHAAGSSKAGKDDMLLAAFTTGYQWDNEHEADAWCLLRYAEQSLGIIENESTPWPANRNLPTTKSSSGSRPKTASTAAVPPQAAPSASPSTRARPAPLSRGVVVSRQRRR